jgi:hypothetical protein
MLYWWHLYRDCSEVAGDWDDRGDFWFPEPLRVCLSAFRFALPTLPDSDAIQSTRDFFPVIITFLRQLPFIGHFLTLPYISTVINDIPFHVLECSCFHIGGRSFGRITSFHCIVNILLHSLETQPAP